VNIATEFHDHAIECITPGVVLTGIEPAEIVSVVPVVPIATDAMQVIYKTPAVRLKTAFSIAPTKPTSPSSPPNVRGPSTVMGRRSSSLGAKGYLEKKDLRASLRNRFVRLMVGNPGCRAN
jgi:hypothetical protein